MKLQGIFITAVAALVLACASPGSAEARSHFSFGYSSPGFSFYVGPRPHYHYYGHRYYRPYYYRPYVYRPYRYSGSRCAYWSRRCAANWGYGNNNYYGCLRYHGCR